MLFFFLWILVSLNDFPVLFTAHISFSLPRSARVSPLASYILLQWQDSYCAQGLYHILMEQGYELKAVGFYTGAVKSPIEWLH